MLNSLVTINHLDENFEPTQSTGKLISIRGKHIELACSGHRKVIELAMSSKIVIVDDPTINFD
jgi:hypothetical protein